MAVYFKCPKCGAYYSDWFGEYSVGDPMDMTSYKCPVCDDTVLVQVDAKEYREAPDSLKDFDTKQKNYRNRVQDSDEPEYPYYN